MGHQQSHPSKAGTMPASPQNAAALADQGEDARREVRGLRASSKHSGKHIRDPGVLRAARTVMKGLSFINVAAKSH